MEKETIESKMIALEAKLLEQEHRPITLIWNYFYKRKKYPKDDPRRKAVAKAIIWRFFFSPNTVAFTLTTLISFLTVFFINRQNNLIENQNHLIEATRRSSQMIILDGVLKDINKELANKDTLSKNLQARIQSLSHTTKPYKLLDYNTNKLSPLLSPERSQLLYSLVSSGIKNDFLAALFKKTNFNYADLNGLNLINRHLKNSKIRYSSLDSTLLHNSIISKADIRNGIIKSTGMPYVIAHYTDFRDTLFDDVNLNSADLSFADLRGTTFLNLNIGNLKTMDSARVGRLDWFNFLKKSKGVKGVEHLEAAYTVKNVFNKKMKKDIVLIVKNKQ